MINIEISEFEANMSRVLRQVQNGESVRLISRGTAIAKLVPPDYAQITARKELVELCKTATLGDVLSPIDGAWTD